MKSDDEIRLEKLRAKYFPPEIKYSDLLLLLAKDESVREEIRRVASEAAWHTTEVDVSDAAAISDRGSSARPHEEKLFEVQAPLAPSCRAIPVAAPLLAASRPAVDPLKDAMAPELELLAYVCADEQLRKAWLGNADEDEGRQLVRLIAVASQWDQILRLWERLAERCKEAQRSATAAELQILSHCLAVHNLIWRGPQARLQAAVVGSPCDERLHERGTANGLVVTAQWLPGLLNAAGQLQKRPLVATRQ